MEFWTHVTSLGQRQEGILKTRAVGEFFFRVLPTNRPQVLMLILTEHGKICFISDLQDSP